MIRLGFALLCFSIFVPRPLFSAETTNPLERFCGPTWAKQNQKALETIRLVFSASKLSLSEAEEAVESLRKLPDCSAKRGSGFYELKESLLVELARSLEDPLSDDDAAGPSAILGLQLFEEYVSSQKARLSYHSPSALVLASLREVQKNACLNPSPRGLASVEELGKEPSLALVEAMSAMERVATQEATKAEEAKQLLFFSPDLDWSAVALHETFAGTVANQVSVRAIDYFHAIANDFSYLSQAQASGGLEAYLGKSRKALLPSFRRLLSKATEQERARWKSLASLLVLGLTAIENGGAGKQDLLRSGFGSATLLEAIQEYGSALVWQDSRLVAAATLDWVKKSDKAFLEAFSRAPSSEWKEPYRESLLKWTNSLVVDSKQPVAPERAEFFRRVLSPQMEHCFLLSELYTEEEWQEVCAKWRCVTAESKGCATESVAQAAETRFVEQGEVCSTPPKKSLTRQILDRLPRFGR